MTDETFVSHWYAALRAPLGIVIMTPDIDRYRQKMYATRTRLGDPELSKLSLVTNGKPGEVLIIRKEPNAA